VKGVSFEEGVYLEVQGHDFGLNLDPLKSAGNCLDEFEFQLSISLDRLV
jgi:hypothetical protein